MFCSTQRAIECLRGYQLLTDVRFLKCVFFIVPKFEVKKLMNTYSEKELMCVFLYFNRYECYDCLLYVFFYMIENMYLHLAFLSSIL
jgi:hypothetical protein